jgi:hypothetical protein
VKLTPPLQLGQPLEKALHKELATVIYRTLLKKSQICLVEILSYLELSRKSSKPLTAVLERLDIYLCLHIPHYIYSMLKE